MFSYKISYKNIRTPSSKLLLSYHTQVFMGESERGVSFLIELLMSIYFHHSENNIMGTHIIIWSSKASFTVNILFL